MDIPQSLIDQTIQHEVRLGDVYKIPMTNQDGITPKDGYSERNKFFIVLGFDGDGNIYGGVIVNSKINPKLPTTITDYYMPIKSSRYKFLCYDSFINCSELKTTTAKKLLSGNKVGEINQEDYNLIVDTIKDSPNENKARLKQFGLI